MKDKLLNILKRFKLRLYVALKRYPIAIALIAAGVVMIMALVHSDAYSLDYDTDTFIKLALSFFYGAAVSLTIKSFSERMGYRMRMSAIVQLIVPVAIVLVYILLLPDYESQKTVLRYALLSAATLSLFFVFPFIKTQKSASYFSQKVFLRLAVTGIYYGVITGGAVAILFAIENLLDVTLPKDIYMQTPLFLAGFFMPSFFFAGIPDTDDAQKDYPKLLEILLHYIVFPLLSIYTAVLYIYFIKILIDFELPSNLLGSLVIYYSLISVAAIYFGRFTRGKSKWTKLFDSIYPYAIILPTLMMLLSFTVRINQYGFTEPRYYAILCVIFVLYSVIMVKLQKKVRYIPLALAVLMIVSVFGPLSSFAVSKRSQTYQLEKALTNAGMLQDGVIVADPDASDDTKHQVTSIINYFDSMHSLSDIKYLDADFTKDDMSDVFGFESYYSYNRFTDSYRIASEYGAFDIIDVQGYDYIADFSKYRERITFQSDDGGIEILASGENSEIMTLSLDGEVLFEIDLLETYMPYFKEDGGSVQHDYSKNYDNDNIRIRIVMISANYVKSDDYTDFDYDLKLMFEIK